MLIDHDLPSLLNHTHYDSLPFMRVDLCDEKAEPIAVSLFVPDVLASVVFSGFTADMYCIYDSLAFRVVQDSRMPLPYLYMSIFCPPILNPHSLNMGKGIIAYTNTGPCIGIITRIQPQMIPP
jgi:hypothetical protein